MKYQAKDIQVLEGLEAVRKRPGMYIGSTEHPNHLVKEILDNSIDEAMNGFASKIEVILEEARITITDDGRGIPVDQHPKLKKPALEVIFTTLHAGGKFSDTVYSSAGGLHGVGASVVNALSDKLEVTVWREGHEYNQRFSRGLPVAGLKKLGKSRKTGTSVTFSADPEIFDSIKFKAPMIRELLRQKAFLNPGLLIIFKSEDKEETFRFDDGLVAYVKELIQEPVSGEVFFLEKKDRLKVSVAFAWTESTDENILSFANGIPTADGGTHVDGFKAGLLKAVRNYLATHDILPKGLKLSADDIREGLVVVLSVMIPGNVAQLQFQGQTKDRLNNQEAFTAVDSLLKSFEQTLNQKPSIAQNLVERMVLACKARSAARAASQSFSRKISVSHRLNLPGKLADCSSSKDTELFIVEGDSAGGTAKQCRDRKTQAILPLRGKVLNTIATAKITDNKELSDLASALGCGVGKDCNPDKLRYDKIIILTDADADGKHIATLLMAFFFRWMKPVIEAGALYLGRPPLFRVKVSGKDFWVYSEKERDSVLKGKSGQVTRFKGLGEMNPSSLWETTLNPKTRTLLRVRIDDEKQVENVFEELLGKDTSARYALITGLADTVEVDL